MPFNKYEIILKYSGIKGAGQIGMVAHSVTPHSEGCPFTARLWYSGVLSQERGYLDVNNRDIMSRMFLWKTLSIAILNFPHPHLQTIPPGQVKHNLPLFSLHNSGILCCSLVGYWHHIAILMIQNSKSWYHYFMSSNTSYNNNNRFLPKLKTVPA